MTDTTRYYVCIVWILASLMFAIDENSYVWDCIVSFAFAIIISFSIWFAGGIIILINEQWKKILKP